MTESPRILIARMSAIGDTILTMPLICALRERFPQAHLGWVVERKAAAVLKGHPCLDQAFILDRLWFRSPANLWKLRSQLRAEKFDVAIDVQCRVKTAFACWLSGAPLRIGLAKPYAKECSDWFDNHIVESSADHLVDRSLALLAPLGIEDPQVDFQYPRDVQADHVAQKWIEQAELQDGFVVINPGAGWASRMWPTERFGEVARHLVQRRGIPAVVTWAGQSEKKMAEEVVAASDNTAIAAPPTSLAELASLLRAARFYVGSDTGPTHQAAAVGTPCVALHGVTRPEKSGAYGPSHIFLQRANGIDGCRNQRQAGNDRMKLISVEDVRQACDQMLQRTTLSKAA